MNRIDYPNVTNNGGNKCPRYVLITKFQSTCLRPASRDCAQAGLNFLSRPALYRSGAGPIWFLDTDVSYERWAYEIYHRKKMLTPKTFFFTFYPPGIK